MERQRTVARLPNIAEIALQYGLQAETWEAHASLYKTNAALRVRDRHESIMIKPFSGSTRAIRRVTRLLVWLREHNYHNMPRLRRTVSGRRYTTQRGQQFYATDWVEGRVLDATHASLYRLGRALAHLHQLHGDSVDLVRVPGLAKLHRLRAYDSQFRNWSAAPMLSDPTVCAWFRHTCQEMQQLANDAWQRLDTPQMQAELLSERVASPLVHGDITCNNVIVTPTGDVQIIDWDTVQNGSSWFELVNALSNTTQFEGESMAALLAGYQSRSPLSRQQRALIRALFGLPREVWYVRRMQGGAERWNEELARVVMCTWNDRVRAMQWLDDWVLEG